MARCHWIPSVTKALLCPPVLPLLSLDVTVGATRRKKRKRNEMPPSEFEVRANTLGSSSAHFESDPHKSRICAAALKLSVPLAMHAKPFHRQCHSSFCSSEPDSSQTTSQTLNHSLRGPVCGLYHHVTCICQEVAHESPLSPTGEATSVPLSRDWGES